ncbi:MAG: lysophospholipid acyltransferase family protein [Gemmatimonadales bacterium]
MPGDSAIASDDSKPSRRITLLARAGGWLVRLLGWTWRIRVTHDDAVRRARADGRAIVFTAWHGELLPLLYHHRGENVTVLVSEHGDGEILARIATELGYGTVRGSTSRGAARALLESARVIGGGHDLAITPDGPRGPAKSFAAGPAIVAQRTGAPVIGASATARPAWRLKSWDRFMVPAPFARVHIAYSDAALVDASDVRTAADDVGRLRALMASAEQRANG